MSGLVAARSDAYASAVTSAIFSFNESKDVLIADVVERTMAAIKDPLPVLSDAAYLETKRLQSSGGSELAEWRQLASRLGKMGRADAERALRKYTQQYADDIAGNFDPRVYRFASRAVAPLIGALLSPRATLKNLPSSLDLAALDGRVVVDGPHAHIRKLSERGTLVFVPTHLSNLDSVVFGFAMERAKLPPATYGAGKNLFTNPVLSFFMHNLGAYRVDRRLRHQLYKDVLKTYSCVLIERGYHSLFFPGGTRSRSGGVERRLKLGLAGTGVEAFARTASRGKAQPVYFVPATINYLLTLEASTLIDDFLQEEGKARYIIDDDESTRFARIAAFIQKLNGLDAACVIRFGTPLDCFGNSVDEDGISRDACGREVDGLKFITDSRGLVRPDALRDAEYTRYLGERVVEQFLQNTVIMSTHLVAAAAFKKLQAQVGSADLFALLRHKDDVVVPRAELADAVDQLHAQVRSYEEAGKIKLLPALRNKSGGEIVAQALRAFAGYHESPVIEPQGEDLVLSDTRLLFYYQNRLAAHGLALDHIAPKPARRA
jgi:glycerol-3-phosphate O-acyltransferase